MIFPAANAAAVLIEVDDSTTFGAGPPFRLPCKKTLQAHFIQPGKDLRNFVTIPKARIAAMRIEQFLVMLATGILRALNAKIPLIFLIAAVPDFTIPFAGPLLTVIFRGTTQAAFSERGASPAVHTAGCQFYRSVFV